MAITLKEVTAAVAENRTQLYFVQLLQALRTTVPFVTAHLEIFHCTHHPVIPKSDLYFTFCSTLNALSIGTKGSIIPKFEGVPDVRD